MAKQVQVLSNIAAVDVGLSFRSRIQNETNGTLSVVQQKDLDEKLACVDTSSLLNIMPSSTLDPVRYGLKESDIIIRTRGNKPFAALVKKVSGASIAAAPLVRVRITSEDVLPNYLVWFLNSQMAAEYFSRNAKGSGVKLIDRKTIAAIEVPALDLERQKVIADIFVLANTEFVISENLSKRRRRLREDQINMIAGGVKNE